MIRGMKVVLHVCCGPCASACVPALRDLGNEVALFFSNSNIDTEAEFEKRLANARKLAEADGVELVADTYDHTDWLEKVAKGFEDAPEKGAPRTRSKTAGKAPARPRAEVPTRRFQEEGRFPALAPACCRAGPLPAILLRLRVLAPKLGIICAMSLRLTFLGTGTSVGVPQIGCTCPTCTSDDPRDRRRRTGLYVQTPGMAFVVDAPPEFRIACLELKVLDVRACLLTHVHMDHIAGFDDLRRFNTLNGKTVLPCYASPETIDAMHRIFPYIGTDARVPPWRRTRDAASRRAWQHANVRLPLRARWKARGIRERLLRYSAENACKNARCGRCGAGLPPRYASAPYAPHARARARLHGRDRAAARVFRPHVPRRETRRIRGASAAPDTAHVRRNENQSIGEKQ